MKHEALTEKLIGNFYRLYNDLGHGFLESVYQKGYVLLLHDRAFDIRSKRQFASDIAGMIWGTFAQISWWNRLS
jgi:hypothetical protein